LHFISPTSNGAKAMIDHTAETLLTFAEAAAVLPDRPHVSTIHRWRLRGIGGVKLDTIRIGGRRYTSHEALERFINATTAAADGIKPAKEAPRKRQRQRHEQAERELDAAGI
jgi:hypothetical protein